MGEVGDGDGVGEEGLADLGDGDVYDVEGADRLAHLRRLCSSSSSRYSWTPQV